MRWLILLCLFFPSCSVNQLDTAAERATFNAIAPEYLNYVDSDAGMNQAAKDRRHRSINTWDIRIKGKEESVGNK